MKELKIQFNDFSEKESIGTIEWVRNFLNNSKVGIFSDTDDAKLCAVLYTDTDSAGKKWETIIAKEACEHTDISVFERQQYHGPYTIAKCYTTTAEKGKEALFTTELTPAAVRLAKRYIEKSIDALVDAIEKRDAAEEEILDNISIIADNGNDDDIVQCVQAVHIDTPEEDAYTWEIPENMYVSDGEYLLIEQHDGNVSVVKSVSRSFKQSKADYLKNTHPYLCRVLKNLGSNVEESILKLF